MTPRYVIAAMPSLLLAWHAAPPTPAPPPLSLVVVIAVDQLRPDYFDRWRQQLTGGLGRFLGRGLFFPGGHQEHAMTETAPGHATLLTGREPSHTNIVSNAYGVGDPTSPVLEAPDAAGASPRRLRGTTLGDWMRAADSATRTLSVSGKDRAAILMSGRAWSPVFWYANGRFTTSRWFTDRLPEWVRRYNTRRGPAHLAGKMWPLLLPATNYPEADNVAYEHDRHDVTFPHRLPGSTAGVEKDLSDYPWMDSLTLDFALEGVRRQGVGARGPGRADLLTISLSSTDGVGHAWGPDSRELHDQVLRLDRWLGQFLDSLGQLVAADRTVLVLTSDHGVQSLPEFAREHGDTTARRIWLGDLGTGYDLSFHGGLITGDVSRLKARGVNTDRLAESLATAARRRPGVIAAFTRGSLARSPATDREAMLWRRQLPDDFTDWLVAVSLRPGSVWSRPDRLTAQHGSTAPKDVGVPIAFIVPGVRPARVQRVARTVDIAPTLAELLGVTPAERLDGSVIPDVVHPRH